MHYIRLLRPPKVVTTSKKGHRLELIITITTDLGDSFLRPEAAPLHLLSTVSCAEKTGEEQTWPSSGDDFQWTAGDRTLKVAIPLSSHIAREYVAGRGLTVCIRPRSSISSAVLSQDVLSDDGDGLIMPAWVTLNQRGKHDILTRRLDIGTAGHPPMLLYIDESIGESIARHIWDAGVVAVYSITALASSSSAAGTTLAQGPCLMALRQILTVDKPLNIIELGCGVGILGLGLSTLLPRFHPHPEDCFILMTDLEQQQQAKHQTEANISQLPSSTLPLLSYENLDWEDGRRENFGAAVSSRAWDLVILSDCTYNVDMLPALVETLSALHMVRGATAATAAATRENNTKVFLATKPRHSSEKALFGLMEKHRWEMLASQVVPLPVLASRELETVELYLFQKS